MYSNHKPPDILWILWYNSLESQGVTMETTLEMFVVYKHPKDFPEDYVIRLWIIDAEGPKATTQYFTAKTLWEVRRFVPAGRVQLDRRPDDEPQIVEVWV